MYFEGEKYLFIYIDKNGVHIPIFNKILFSIYTLYIIPLNKHVIHKALKTIRPFVCLQQTHVAVKPDLNSHGMIHSHIIGLFIHWPQKHGTNATYKTLKFMQQNV